MAVSTPQTPTGSKSKTAPWSSRNSREKWPRHLDSSYRAKGTASNSNRPFQETEAWTESTDICSCLVLYVDWKSCENLNMSHRGIVDRDDISEVIPFKVQTHTFRIKDMRVPSRLLIGPNMSRLIWVAFSCFMAWLDYIPKIHTINRRRFGSEL